MGRFVGGPVNAMNWEPKEKRQGHPQEEEAAREGEEQRFCLLLSVIPN